MNQVQNLEHAINLARCMITSATLWETDQAKGKELLGLLKAPKIDLSIIQTHADYFRRKSMVPRDANYFRDYEEGIRMYKDMANALNQLLREL